MWKSPAVSGPIKRICAAAPAWKFSESREVLSAYEMGAPAMRSPMADTSATEMWPMTLLTVGPTRTRTRTVPEPEISWKLLYTYSTRSCSCRAAPALGAAPLRGEADRASGVRSPRARRLLHRAFARASGTAFARERSARVSEMNAVVSDRTNACERERRSRIGRKTSEKHPANFSISAAKFARATPDAVLRRRVLFILRLHTEKPIPRFWFFLKRA